MWHGACLGLCRERQGGGMFQDAASISSVVLHRPWRRNDTFVRVVGLMHCLLCDL